MSHVPLPAPSADFRPAAATDAELAKYGFPPRPAPAASPSLARLWDQTFGRDVEWALARFTPVANFPSSRRQKAVISEDNTSPNWSGVIASAQPSEPINLAITANWNVPELTATGAGTDWIAIWVGLDGGGPGSPSLLQAGIAGTAQAKGVPGFYAWCAWLSPTDKAPAQSIANFPVQSGDVVQAQIWVTSPTTATIVLSQISATSQSAPVMASITAPPGVHVVGATAEWIVERPLIGSVLSTLADYTPVTFNDAWAWSGAGTVTDSLKTFALRTGRALPISAASLAASLDFVRPVSLRILMNEAGVVAAGSGSATTMEENGSVLSYATILGNDSLRCNYGGP